MSLQLNGDTGVTFNDASLQGAAASPYVLKNRIINGAMVIDQRNAGASITPTNGQFSVDRWACFLSQTSKYSAQQNAASVTPPAGFTNYLGVTSLSAYSITSTDLFLVNQNIEGFNVADLGWGTANAQTITLSFWVRSSLTGTFGGSLRNSALNRSYPFSYTITTANTWEKETITIAGDTSGTWLTTNGTGINLGFGLGVGSTYSGTAGSWSGSNFLSATGATSVVGTNGATFYITGVQLEQNTSATPFERRMYGQELANCQRYYWQQNYTQLVNRFGTGLGIGTTTVDGIIIQLPTTMRTSPTATVSNIGLYDGTSTYTISSLGQNYSTPVVLSCIANSSSSITAGKAIQLYAINSSAVLAVTAEL
jgi:hypothetical protein